MSAQAPRGDNPSCCTDATLEAHTSEQHEQAEGTTADGDEIHVEIPNQEESQSRQEKGRQVATSLNCVHDRVGPKVADPPLAPSSPSKGVLLADGEGDLSHPTLPPKGHLVHTRPPDVAAILPDVAHDLTQPIASSDPHLISFEDKLAMFGNKVAAYQRIGGAKDCNLAESLERIGGADSDTGVDPPPPLVVDTTPPSGHMPTRVQWADAEVDDPSGGPFWEADPVAEISTIEVGDHVSDEGTNINHGRPPEESELSEKLGFDGHQSELAAMQLAFVESLQELVSMFQPNHLPSFKQVESNIHDATAEELSDLISALAGIQFSHLKARQQKKAIASFIRRIHAGRF